MIWYIDQFGYKVHGTDLYGQNLWKLGRDGLIYNAKVHVFHAERLYRYSGSLYINLNSMINIECLDEYFRLGTVTNNLSDPFSDNCGFMIFRYFLGVFTYSGSRELWTTQEIIKGEYYDKIYYHTNAHFVDT